MSEIICFLGSYPSDICMYAAYALQNAGKSVCVVDNSQDGILFRCVPTPDERLAAVTFRQVDFLRREPPVQWHELDYEFVLVQMGSRPQELCLALCSMRILVVDCECSNLDFYRRYMQESSLSMTVLLRGFLPDRILLGRIKQRLEMGQGFIERWLLLPFDEADEAYRIEMQYGRIHQFPYISAGMERMLTQLLRMLGVHDKLRVMRAVRDAKQGKTAENVCNKRKRLVMMEG